MLHVRKAALEQLELVMIDNCILVSEATECDRSLCSDVLLLLPRDVLLAITVPSICHNLLRDYGSCMMTRIRGAGKRDSASTRTAYSQLCSLNNLRYTQSSRSDRED